MKSQPAFTGNSRIQESSIAHSPHPTLQPHQPHQSCSFSDDTPFSATISPTSASILLSLFDLEKHVGTIRVKPLTKNAEVEIFGDTLVKDLVGARFEVSLVDTFGLGVLNRPEE